MYQLRGGCLNGSLAGCGPQPYGISLGEAGEDLGAEYESLVQRLERQEALARALDNELVTMFANYYQHTPLYWHVYTAENAQANTAYANKARVAKEMAAEVLISANLLLQFRDEHPEFMLAMEPQERQIYGERIGGALQGTANVVLARAKTDRAYAQKAIDAMNGMQDMGVDLGMPDIVAAVDDMKQKFLDTFGETLEQYLKSLQDTTTKVLLIGGAVAAGLVFLYGYGRGRGGRK